jgi:hypothetical protein
MGFALPWALLGLLAVAAPIAAHLMRRHKLPRQTLPTVAFLRRVQAARTARVRIVDLLLLASRVALVALLAFAAARPYRVVESSLAGRQHALAVVLDDSMSMSAMEQGTTRLQRATAFVSEHLESLAPGTEVSLVLGGKPARVLARQQVDLKLLAESLAGIEPRSVRAGALCPAVEIARELLQESELGDRRLLVVSDFAGTPDTHDCNWPQSGIELAFERVSTGAVDNRRIAEVHVAKSADGDGMMTLDVRVAGSASQKSQPVLRLRDREQELARVDVDWDRGEGYASIELPEGISPDAVIELQLLPDDVLPEDNLRAVPLRSQTIHVLLVDGDPHPDPRKRETAFLRHALEVAPQADRSFVVNTVDAQDITETAIVRADVVVLANVALNPSWVPLLRRFVAGGGGLWITAGDRVESRVYTGVLGDLLPARYTATRDELRPLNLQSTELPELSQSSVRVRTPLEPTALSAVTLASFSDGSPALIEHRYGSGRVAMLATTADDAWTDLPYQPVFPAFVYGLLERLAAQTSERVEPYQTVMLPGSTSSQRMQILMPSGQTLDLPEGDRTPFANTQEVGAYRILINGVEAERFSFVVDPPPAESELEGHAPPPIDETQRLVAGSTLAKDETPLASWFLLIAALVLLVEVWLRQARRT